MGSLANLPNFQPSPTSYTHTDFNLLFAALTIAAGAVGTNELADNGTTLAKLQQLATDTLLGRATVGTGNVETISCTASGRALLAAASASAQKLLLEKAVSTIVAVAALDVDCSAGVYFTKTIAGASAFTFSNVPAGGAYAFTLEITHTSGTITWPASVKWPNDTAPTLTTGKTHLCSFVTSNGGTRWRGAILANYAN